MGRQIKMDLVMVVQVVKTTVKAAAGVKETNYAAILDADMRQVGFITDEGIFLELYNSKLQACGVGAYQKIDTGDAKPFRWLCKIVEDNWDAMYDRYTLAIKG